MEKENADTGSYTLIAVYPLRIDGQLCVTNPKGLMAMNKDKADGSIKWWRRITCQKDYPCFYYDTEKESIFNEDDEEVNEEKVIELIKRFNGYVPGDEEDPFNLN